MRGLGWVRTTICLSFLGPALLGGAPSQAQAVCSHYDSDRQPFFGETHAHSNFSYDANLFRTAGGPRDVYRFAKGEMAAPLPKSSSEPGIYDRTIALDEPLDFAIVTDHAEWLGPTNVCRTQGAPGSSSEDCADLLVWNQFRAIKAFLQTWRPPVQENQEAMWPVFCANPGVDCKAGEIAAWQDTQAAAEEFQDRSSACSFTTCPAWEYSSALFGVNLHRNVIFRNEIVPAEPTSAVDTAHDVTKLWDALQTQCLDAGTGCEPRLIVSAPSETQSRIRLPDGARWTASSRRSFSTGMALRLGSPMPATSHRSAWS